MQNIIISTCNYYSFFILSLQNLVCILFYFFKDFSYLLFRERGREGEREVEKHQCATDTLISHLFHVPTRDLTRNAGTTQACADWESNWWTIQFTGQHLIHWATHQPGQVCILYVQSRLIPLQRLSSHVWLQYQSEKRSPVSLQHLRFMNGEPEAQKDEESLSKLVACQTPSLRPFESLNLCVCFSWTMCIILKQNKHLIKWT